jgi:hypothetical protein
VRKLIERFPEIIDRAFTARTAGITLTGARYKTRPLVDLLKEYFGDDYMFGGPSASPHQYATKVAVTSATETANRAVIFANYNRQDAGRGKFSRSTPSSFGYLT